MDFHGADENIELYERARTLVHEGAYDEARALADRLEEQHYSGAFEVGALARAGQGDVEDAVAYLQQGTAFAPKVWINWQLLGNYLSDLERYDEAVDAYAEARGCPGVDHDSVALNQAILAGRMGEPAKAHAFLAEVTHPDFTLPAEDVRIGLLMDAGRHEEAVQACEDVLHDLREEAEPDELAAGRIAGHLARSRSALGADRDSVLAAVHQGLAYDPSSEYLLWALREADLRTSADTRLFRLLLVGQVTEESDHAFFVTYNVAHETVEAALAAAREVEGARGCVRLELEESEVRQPRPDLPWGVYYRSGRSWFPLEEDEPQG